MTGANKVMDTNVFTSLEKGKSQLNDLIKSRKLIVLYLYGEWYFVDVSYQCCDA